MEFNVLFVDIRRLNKCFRKFMWLEIERVFFFKFCFVFFVFFVIFDRYLLNNLLICDKIFWWSCFILFVICLEVLFSFLRCFFWDFFVNFSVFIIFFIFCFNVFLKLKFFKFFVVFWIVSILVYDLCFFVK